MTWGRNYALSWLGFVARRDYPGPAVSRPREEMLRWRLRALALFPATAELMASRRYGHDRKGD